MVETLAVAGVVLLVLLVALVRVVGGGSAGGGAGRDDDRPDTDAQRERDEAHRAAQRRPPREAARKGEAYEVVVRETKYDRVPEEVRGTINGLQTFVRDVPGDLEVGDVIRVRVVDYGHKGTTAQATYLERA